MRFEKIDEKGFGAAESNAVWADEVILSLNRNGFPGDFFSLAQNEMKLQIPLVLFVANGNYAMGDSLQRDDKAFFLLRPNHGFTVANLYEKVNDKN